MKIRILYTLSLFAFLTIALQCKTDESKKVIKKVEEERWSLKKVAGEFVKDTILFLEAYHYNSSGEIEGHIFYNSDKSLKGKSLSLFTEDVNHPVGAEYKDADDNVLSYYNYTFKGGIKKSSNAYDAETNELLRIEDFEYDSKGKLAKKTIKDAAGNISRTMHYSYDSKGNESTVEVKDKSGKILLSETFDITKYDGEENWTEKWGFVEEEPFSYRLRRIQYY